jgi:aminoglycoside phosphotransferase (APT) family kinase protein
MEGTGGARLQWTDLPLELREKLEERLGSPVAKATTQPGGFSPGLAARLILEDGSRVFLKAVGAKPNPDSPDFHRREARIAAALPDSAPVPRFLWCQDDGEWVALAFEDIEGRQPDIPWPEDQLQRVLDSLTRLTSLLSPSPIETQAVADCLGGEFTGWRSLHSVKSGGEPAAEATIEVWGVADLLDDLVALESGWEEAARGETLLHLDLRADNILLTDDRVYFVDWPHACVGAPWIDLVGLLPSVAMQGGPKPWEVFERHPLGRSAPPDRLAPVVAALAGYFVWGSTLPPPPGIPTVRTFQAGQGRPALQWARYLLRRGVE